MTTTTYESDFYQWTQQQADLLRKGALSTLDVEHLIEEIDSMGRRDKGALRSYLLNVAMHLLKWQYQPERRGIRWRLSIENGRDQIAWQIKDSPSLLVDPNDEGVIAVTLFGNDGNGEKSLKRWEYPINNATRINLKHARPRIRASGNAKNAWILCSEALIRQGKPPAF
jgi:hypothetical protein